MACPLIIQNKLFKINKGTDIIQFPLIRLNVHEPYKIAFVYSYPSIYLSVLLPLNNSPTFCIDNSPTPVMSYFDYSFYFSLDPSSFKYSTHISISSLINQIIRRLQNARTRIKLGCFCFKTK